MAQMAILTDLNRCVGCGACSAACKMVNEVPIGDFWIKVLRIGPNPMYDGAQSPDVEMYFLPISCQHCKNPACVSVCPTQASHKLEDGTIQIDKEKCIGCQFCVMACPYNVRYLNEEERVVEKCTLCEQRTSSGELPQCVYNCGGRARWYGDIEKGFSSFVAQAEYDYQNGATDYDTLHKTFVTAGEYLEDFSDSDVHYLPDVGNHPSSAFILRGKKWQA